MSLVGKVAQQKHHLAIQPRIEARCRLIQEEDAGIGQQFKRDRDTLALASGKFAHQQTAAMLHIHIFQYLVDTLRNLCLAKVVGQAHFGCVVKRALDSQITVDDVILRHIAKLGAESGEVSIVILAVVEYEPFLRRP